MFIAITSGTTAKAAVAGESLWTSKKATVEAAAADVAKQAGLGAVESVTPHTKNPYQHNIIVGGATVLRLLDSETTPKRKIPAGL